MTGSSQTLTFTEDSYVEGTTGCNHDGAGYTASGREFRTVLVYARKRLAVVDPALRDTEWLLTSLLGDSLMKGSRITLNLGRERFEGYAGCNDYGGGYEVANAGILLTTGIFLTAVACRSREGVVEQEMVYVEALGRSAAYRLTNGRLEMAGAGGEMILVFTRKDQFAADPNALPGTVWRLAAKDGDSLTEKSTFTPASYGEHILGGYAGCRGYLATYEATGDDLNLLVKVMLNAGCQPGDADFDQEAKFLDVLAPKADLRLGDGQRGIFSALSSATASTATECGWKRAKDAPWCAAPQGSDRREGTAMRYRMLLAVCVFVLLASAVPTAADAAMGGPARRIRFLRGATSGVVSGQLAPNQTHEYVLRASAGQIMQVVLWPPTDEAGLLIWGADGTPLKRWPDEELGWQGKLSRTQDYYLQVVALDRSLHYCLRVTVFARIQFAQGADSATVSSPAQQCVPQAPEVVGGYALRASAGQTMRVALSSPNQSTYLTIVGADGEPLRSTDDWSTAWQGVLPSTQDYYLLPVSVGDDPRFTITVWISPLGQAAPTRIRFRPGTESGTVSGQLTPGSPARYVLWAARGQRMEIRIWPPPCLPSPVIDVTVTGPGSAAWQRLGLDSAIGPLPDSGDYVINLALQSGRPCTGYAMQVTIPAR